MIKYLTERLRQYTLNEEQSNSKVKESDHDSGAESDDQNPTMESEECSGGSSGGGGGRGSRRHHHHHNHNDDEDDGGDLISPTSSPYFLDSALPSDCDLTYDHHSSEEELEVINSSVVSRRSGVNGSGSGGGVGRRSKDVIRCRSVSSVLPEKRKWSDAMDSESAAAAAGSELSSLCHRSRVRISSRRQQSSSDENMYATDGLGEGAASGQAISHKFANSGCSSGASSDDETTPSGAFAPIAPSTPVNFSRSPPLNAHKPPTLRSLSPPLKMLNCDSTTVEQQRSQVISPRYKRHRLTPTQRGQHAHSIQRPCLDFEKMQQMKENAVTTWRHHSNGEHGGELSLYCW